MRSVSFLLMARRSLGAYAPQGNLVQGTLDMLILMMLALQSMHGNGIKVRLEQVSNGLFASMQGRFAGLDALASRNSNFRNRFRARGQRRIRRRHRYQQ